MSDIENNTFDHSEQAESSRLPLPMEPLNVPLGTNRRTDRAYLIGIVVRKAEADVGGPLQVFGREVTLLERLQHVLAHARYHNLEARYYSLVWMIERHLAAQHVSDVQKS